MCGLFFREDISVTNKVDVSKGGGHVLEQHLGFADGYVFFGVLSFFSIMFLFVRINPEDTT